MPGSALCWPRFAPGSCYVRVQRALPPRKRATRDPAQPAHFRGNRHEFITRGGCGWMFAANRERQGQMRLIKVGEVGQFIEKSIPDASADAEADASADGPTEPSNADNRRWADASANAYADACAKGLSITLVCRVGAAGGVGGDGALGLRSCPRNAKRQEEARGVARMQKPPRLTRIASRLRRPARGATNR